MPLKKGRSRSTIGKNIKEMLNKFKQTGKIGSQRPGSMKKAVKVAAAAAFRAAGKSRKKTNKKPRAKARKKKVRRRA